MPGFTTIYIIRSANFDGYAMGDAVAVRLHKLRRKKIE